MSRLIWVFARPRLICVFTGHTCIFVGFVMRRLICPCQERVQGSHPGQVVRSTRTTSNHRISHCCYSTQVINLTTGCSRKKLRGVFDGIFILYPPPIRFNYCLGPPPIRSNYQSTPPPTWHITLFFCRAPFYRIVKGFSHSSQTTHQIHFERRIPTELHCWEEQPPT